MSVLDESFFAEDVGAGTLLDVAGSVDHQADDVVVPACSVQCPKEL